jgi:hypothetical protein
MMIKLTVGVLVLALMPWSGAIAQKKTGVDLELAFVVDASGSIDDEETRLQRQGYADALVHPRVLGAISSGFLRSIAVAYIEFAGPGCTRIAVPWARIDGAEAAKAFGAAILATERMFCPGGNAIGDAVVVATDSIEKNGFLGTRRVIDVSGDGPNTIGEPVEIARNLAVALGITINGLVIERPSFPDLDEYYRQAIIGGPGHFVLKAENRKTFAQAILKKMILEIAGMTPEGYQARR